MKAESEPSPEQNKNSELIISAYVKLSKVLNEVSEGIGTIDLNRSRKWKEAKKTENYSIEKLHLPVDDLRKATADLRKILHLVSEGSRRDMDEVLTRADLI